MSIINGQIRLNFGRLLHPDWRSPNGAMPVRMEEPLRPMSDNRCTAENEFAEGPLDLPPPSYTDFIREAYPNGYPYHKLSSLNQSVTGSVNIEMTPFLPQNQSTVDRERVVPPAGYCPDVSIDPQRQPDPADAYNTSDSVKKSCTIIFLAFVMVFVVVPAIKQLLSINGFGLSRP